MTKQNLMPAGGGDFTSGYFPDLRDVEERMLVENLANELRAAQSNGTIADCILRNGFKFERASTDTVTIYDEILNDTITAEVMSAALGEMGIKSTPEGDGIQVLIPEGQRQTMAKDSMARAILDSIVEAAPPVSAY